jgi:hypothetical protein
MGNPRRMFLRGVTSRARHAVIADLSRLIAACGGDILEHHAFSNKAIAIAFEMGTAGLTGLLEGLGQAEVHLLDADAEALLFAAEATDPAPAEPRGLLAASLQITFFHDEPDLRQEVPQVPG